jgi:hypothetical protein
MPLLFLPANRSDGGGGGGVMVSPLANFTDAAHAAHAQMWRHGPNGRLTSLPPGYTHTTLLVASASGPTATIGAWRKFNPDPNPNPSPSPNLNHNLNPSPNPDPSPNPNPNPHPNPTPNSKPNKARGAERCARTTAPTAPPHARPT